MADTLAAVLKLDGYAVDVAYTAVEAREALPRHRYHAVVSDLRLSDGAWGLNLLAEVKRRHPQALTLLLTAEPSLESAIEALHQGVFAYLIKPCNLDDLRQRLTRGLEAAYEMPGRLETGLSVIGSWCDVLRRRLRAVQPPDRDDLFAPGLAAIRATVNSLRDTPGLPPANVTQADSSRIVEPLASAELETYSRQT
ncbi:MAG: response regulator [Chloroflexi bacterium]|nr:response regulator [Chloroflexota bacterium]